MNILFLTMYEILSLEKNVCSTEGAKASAIFHTIIESCKLLGISAREYICRFLKEVSLGRTDWQNLTPAKLYQ